MPQTKTRTTDKSGGSRPALLVEAGVTVIRWLSVMGAAMTIPALALHVYFLQSLPASLPRRTSESLLTLAFCGLLVWPYRTIRHPSLQWTVGACLIAAAVFLGYGSIRDSRSSTEWPRVLVASAGPLVFAANAAALAVIARRRRGIQDILAASVPTAYSESSDSSRESHSASAVLPRCW